jgi:hypothetical protein
VLVKKQKRQNAHRQLCPELRLVVCFLYESCKEHGQGLEDCKDLQVLGGLLLSACGL